MHNSDAQGSLGKPEVANSIVATDSLLSQL